MGVQLGGGGFLGLADEEVVRRAHVGESDAARCLVERYRPVVATKAQLYFWQGADRDDVFQEGMIGLCKAIRDYQEDRTATFRHFADLCITRQIISAVKSATRHKHNPLNGSLSLDQSVLVGSKEMLLLDVIPDHRQPAPDEQVIQKHLPRTIRYAFRNTLSDLERGALRCYLAGKSYRESSDHLGYPPKTIDNALQRVKRKLGQLLEE